MSEPLQFMVAGIFGLLLGLLFFWGLWIAVKGLEQSRHPAARMVLSLLLRTGIAVAGFYLTLRHGGWPHLLLALGGFILARILVRRWLGQRYSREESEG